ncbi:hypothetical protein DLAC_09067 [Tieghemostelium lacteum]|uniref:Saposin B-type domain-containing protein n=1 Tax=Tieghemostelium lacteum TaxID=361077 RepID=A0A151Z9A6_TIELA|nr:hypothetical protein DLAC_09067 [Tieghemostelium lacteum]|eukprot:KYQ90444.1 hypothetical protein DLAC_09067 [Tieghemostelium lacteum]
MKTIIILSIILVSLCNHIASASLVSCEMCEFTVKAAEDLVAENFTTSEIMQNLEHACSFLPEKWAPTCEIIVNQYGLMIISGVINHETPQVACSQLRLCPRATAAKGKKAQEKSSELLGFHWHHHGHNPVKHYECKACDWAVKKSEGYVLSGKSEREVETLVDRDCDHFEIHEAVHICKKIIHESVKKIVEELKKHETPERVCKTIHMC